MKRQFAEQYGSLEHWHWWFRGRQRILEMVLRRELKWRPCQAIVSVGCGPAEGLNWLMSLVRPHGRVVGLDADVLQARNRAPGLEYVVGKIEAAPLGSGSFDVVLALDVLEHLDDDAAGLREAARLLKPSGLLVVTVPALPSLWGRQDVVSHHRRRYTKQTLCQAFAEAQLPHPYVTYFNMLLFPAVAAIRWVRHGLGSDQHLGNDFDDNHPGLINEILTAIFAFERYWVGRVSMPVGVSLLASARLC